MHIIDFETRSACNLRTEGLARYCRHGSTEPLCLAYILHGDTEPQLWLPHEPRPAALFDGRTLAAFNAGFEKAIWQYTLYWPDVQWYCIAAHSRASGLPGGLDNLSTWFGLGDEGKDKEGKSLIDQLCVPIKTGKRKGEFRTELEFPELFQKLYRYCEQDCRAEKTILERLPPWPQKEYDTWLMTAGQNERGCPIDLDLCHSVVTLTDQLLDRAKTTIVEATGGKIVSPTQTTALRTWLNEAGVNIDNVGKETIAMLIKQYEDRKDKDNPIYKVLKARQVGAPAAIRKFKTALAQQVDGRLFNCFMYAGAGATARFSATSAESTGTQLQNLFRGEQPEEMLDIIKLADADILTAISDEPIRELQNATRAMLCAGPGNTFLYSDLNAIEPRMARWLTNAPSLNIFRRLDAMTDAKEKKRNDFYRQAAVATLKKSIDAITETDRQMFKVLELSGQYGCGWLKLQMTVEMWTRGTIKLTDALAQAAIKTWRQSNPEIVKGWRDTEKAFRMVFTGERETVRALKCVFSKPYKDTVAITLPSGRLMYYNRCKIVDKEIQCVKHDGTPIKIYGGHLLENITQAASRDILAEKMLECEAAGLLICHHAHDQVLHECPESEAQAKAPLLEKILITPPTWATDLPLWSPVKITRRML